jgi:predicted ATPase/signal transduction histidine kinase
MTTDLILEATLGGDAFLTWHRAHRLSDARPVIVGMLGEQVAVAAQKRFDHEMSLRAELSEEWALKPLSVLLHQGRSAIVLQDPGVRPMRAYFADTLAKGDDFKAELGVRLQLAIRLSDALAGAHAQGLIHKDIQPCNVWVHPVTGHVWLTGFGMASRAPREHQAPEPIDVIQGALAYMAPEQTGRMNRSVDSRSDLYALGVTLYELFTGVLPYQASTAMEWVHCHIARQPLAAATRNHDLPLVLSDIIMKLMAKTAEDRYQSADGLKADLKRCLQQWEQGGHLEPFELATQDTLGRLATPEKLYGRERETRALLSAFEQVTKSGASRLVLVSGYSGSGKSSLVAELHQAMVHSPGIFLSGKFDQYKRDIPYATLAQAFDAFVRQLLVRSEADMGAWRNAILQAVGAQGQILIDVIPALQHLIGPQPAVQLLLAQEAQNRFQSVFAQFLCVFANEKRPMVLFLDDLQWLDAASLKLIEYLLELKSLQYFLLVGAYRDNEVTQSHPLMLTLESLKQGPTVIDELVLAPLGADELLRLVSDTLLCAPLHAAPLSQLVHEKTVGNPFFAIQFLGELAQDHLLTFNRTKGMWQWDMPSIRAKDITDNVVALMVRKLQRLNERTVWTLQRLACLGNRASVALIQVALSLELSEVESGLLEALRQGLVLRDGNTYQFQHDRVQEAAYSLIPAAELAELHLAIGRRLRDYAVGDSTSEPIFEEFDVVNHLNRATALILDAHERAMLCRLNAQVGQRAKAAGSFSAARNYLANALALMPGSAWRDNYGPTFELHMHLGECEFLVGNFERSDALFNVVLNNATSRHDQAKIYGLLIPIYQFSGRYSDSVDAGLKGLALFGITVPLAVEEINALTQSEFERVQAAMQARTFGELLDAPLVVDPDAQAVISLMASILTAAFNGRVELTPLLTAMAFNLTLQHGNMRETCYVYSIYAAFLIGRMGDAKGGLALSNVSIQLNERFNDLRLRGLVNYLHGAFVDSWFQPFTSAVGIMNRAFASCVEVGDKLFSGFCSTYVVQSTLEANVPLDQFLAVARKSGAYVVQNKNVVLTQVIRMHEQFAYCMQGLTLSETSFNDGNFDDSNCLTVLKRAGYYPGVGYLWLLKLMTAVLYQRHDDALLAVNQGSKFLVALGGMSVEVSFHFYRALTQIALLPSQDQDEQAQTRKALDRAVSRFKLWATNCPANYHSRYALLSAELARLDGDDLQAMRWYEDAIRSAKDSELLLNESLINEFAARFYFGRGFATTAHAYLRNARYGYLRWGALAKVRQIDQAYPGLGLDVQALPGSKDRADESLAQMDLMSVVKASQAVSGEIVLDRLVQSLLSVVMEHAGAAGGLLILRKGDLCQVQAQGEVQGEKVVVAMRQSPVTKRDLPESMLQYVLRTGERVLLDDAGLANPYSADPYLREHAPKSVLCVPLLKQAKLVGVLYLENKLAAGAFTPGRIAVLELLASQAAISLENAALYNDLQQEQAHIQELNDNLERRVAQRTAELSAAVQRLTSTQEELVHAEKLASLGAMVAGISHELNTPIGICVTVTSTIEGRLKTFSGMLHSGTLRRSDMNTFLADMTEMVGLVSRSIRNSADLISSFKQVSADQASEQRRSFELSRVVEDVAASLRPGLKGQPWEIVVDIPVDIVCDSYPGPLGQIVTNLIQNAAIHAFIGRTEGTILITATQAGQEVVMQVRDNGIGMDARTAKHAFDPFFTTRMGRGSGLGLSICHRIATSTLGGSLTLDSEPGLGSCFTLKLSSGVQLNCV